MTSSRTTRVTRLATRLVAATAAGAGVLALTVAPAHADKHERDDKVGDVTQHGDIGTSSDRIKRAADLVRVRVNHKDDVIRVVAWVDDLSRADQLAVVGRIATAEGEVFQLTGVRRSPLRRGGEQRNNFFFVDSEQTGPVECDGVTGSFVNSEDRVWLRAPRSCFGDPASIRYGVGTSGQSFLSARRNEGLVGGQFAYVTDDARRNGSAPAMLSDLKIGRQVLAAG